MNCLNIFVLWKFPSLGSFFGSFVLLLWKSTGLCSFYHFIFIYLLRVWQCIIEKGNISVCGSSNRWLVTNLNTIASIVFTNFSSRIQQFHQYIDVATVITVDISVCNCNCNLKSCTMCTFVRHCTSLQYAYTHLEPKNLIWSNSLILCGKIQRPSGIQMFRDIVLFAYW